nr:type I restriction-modification system subunit M N-terminal domain-containing protein [Halalkalicoccus subterraneus]
MNITEDNIPVSDYTIMTLSLDALESHLFKCADIIRDAVDPTDYKDYILPLVYYKTISDEFEQQYEQNVEDYGEEHAQWLEENSVRLIFSNEDL